MKRALFHFVVFSLFLCPNAAVFAKSLENIHLVWKPTTAVKPISKTEKFVERVTVEDFTDARKMPERIGEHRKKDGPVLYVTTKDNMSAYVTEGFRKSLENAGFSTVKTGGELIVGGEIRKYFVTEAGAYKGEIEIEMRIKDAQGQTLWSGVMTGTQDRWGISYKADNYFEVLSDMIVNILNTMLADSGTKKFFIKR